MTEADLISRLAAVNTFADVDEEAFHGYEDALAIDVFEAIAAGTIWDARKAAHMMYDQMLTDATRWYA